MARLDKRILIEVELPFSPTEMAWILGMVGTCGVCLVALLLQCAQALVALVPLGVMVWAIARRERGAPAAAKAKAGE